MDVRVRFVFDKSTGKAEIVIDDLGSRLPPEEHNRKHDEVSLEIGSVIDRNPRVTTILPGASPMRESPPNSPSGPGDDPGQEPENRPAKFTSQGPKE